MKFQLGTLTNALGLALAIGMAGCGGGGGGGTPTGSNPPVVTTTDVSTTVIDGAIKNAVVCMDKNGNGLCDIGEPSGVTDATGKVIIAVPNADVGKYPLLAMVGTNAVDVDNGTITVAYTMSAPAANAALISPLTHLVQETVASTGVSAAEAERALQSTTGITASLFQDFTTVAAPADGSPSAKTVARMVVVATQAQVTALAPAVGTTAIDSATITQADINRAINQRLLQILPALVAAISDPANAALTGTAKETAIVNAVSSSLLTTASMPTLVAINNQATTAANAGTPTGTVVAATPTAGFNLAGLSFTNATNWFVRTFGGDATQNTADANNNTRFVDRKYRSNSGAVANWNFGNNPQDQANLHWTGSAWEACGLNFESLSSLRDAAGNNISQYCNNYSSSKSNRVTFDVAGKTMTQVYDQVRSAGYTNLTIANSATALGAATFPAGSLLYYQATTPLTQAYAYTPGSGSEIFNYSAAVAVGGDSRTQAAGVGCNSAEFGLAPAIRTATLEGLVAGYKGAPCIYNPSSLVANGVTYNSGEVQSEVWGGTSLGISTLGAVNVGGTPTSFYTGNTKIRLAFTGTGNNPVTYYACKERFTNGSIRNCSAIGTGTYTITALGDARVMTLSNPPAQAAPFTFTRTFVERGGKVYFGYQDKFTVTNTARLNTTAANAMLTQLGVPTIDYATPMALTAASYQGAWNVRDPSVTGGGTTLNIAQSGAITCTETPTGLAQPCSLSFTNAATGAISGTIDGASVIAGSLNFITGIGTGTYSLPAPGGNFVATRR